MRTQGKVKSIKCHLIEFGDVNAIQIKIHEALLIIEFKVSSNQNKL